MQNVTIAGLLVLVILNIKIGLKVKGYFAGIVSVAKFSRS